MARERILGVRFNDDEIKKLERCKAFRDARRLFKSAGLEPPELSTWARAVLLEVANRPPD